MSIVCAAIIGKANNPLFLQSFEETQPDEDLRFHYIVHTSLDMIEEKIDAKRAASAGAKKQKSQLDMFLGLLHPTEEHNVYGYVTNTKIKFVVVASDECQEAVVRVFLRRLHTLYANQVSNPFYTPDDRITSQKFADAVAALAASVPTSSFAADVLHSTYRS